MANTKPKTQYKTQSTPAQHSHKVRTFFSAMAGSIAVWLILSTLTVVWLNRTLTNTDTFVGTVAPLVEKPEIQQFVADKVSDQLVQNAPTKDLARQLLPAKVIKANQTTEQLKTQLKPIINQSVLQIVKSQQFDTLWKTTITNAHASFIRQLNNTDTNSLTLDLSPAITGVVDQMKSTQLKPVANKIDITPNTGKLIIKSDNISRIHKFYKLFKEATVGIIVLTILMIVLSVWLSVHHGKTARRIVFTTGILALLQALILQAPSVATFSGKSTTQQAAARVLTESLLHNLQVASVLVGVVFLAAAVASKLYIKFRK